jgi:hypothetical protein
LRCALAAMQRIESIRAMAVWSVGEVRPSGFGLFVTSPSAAGRARADGRWCTRLLLVVWLASMALATGVDRAGARHHRDHAKPNAVAEELPKGPFQVIISISDQRLSLYGSDGLITRVPVSTGMHGHPTPLGVFSVIQKQKWHRSNIYSAAPMPFMQRITWSGVALHAGVLPGYPASHGCIRMSNAFAVRLYHLTKVGTRVIITRKDVAPAEIAPPALLPPAPAEDTSASPQPPAPAEVKTAAAVEAAPAQSEGADALDPSEATEKAAALEPITVFVSRKTQKLAVRQGFAPLFDSPVRFEHPELAIGTHIFTAIDTARTAMRWTLVSMPEETTRSEPRKDERKASFQAKPAKIADDAVDRANRVLDRIHIPSDVYDRIFGLLSPGSSLIISDDAVSNETGSDTDFIVVTH